MAHVHVLDQNSYSLSMSLVNAKSNNNLKTKLQALVTAKDPTISFIEPAISRSDCWTSFSQIQLSKISQDYVVCLSSGTVLKWISENGTKVMKNHSCPKKNGIRSITLKGRQRTTSSYCEAQPNDYAAIKHQLTEACIEYCVVDSRSFESVSDDGFISLAKQLMDAGAIVARLYQ
ncbi:unnamed protein product [Didymodactylos carnosus]|uniref:Uncharacterized protein n=1 Tax=Didymodactylos carnosus TaxID=1234261 RepID=A0A814AXL6_9BILA|nr:unnamed protein product [Didymodactylos carnosus]CAF3700320.1 unnamed protein product [Didymodactylos carnosus]